MAEKDKEEGETTEAPPPVEKKSKTLIFAIVGVVVLLACIGTGAFFFLKSQNSTETVSKNAAQHGEEAIPEEGYNDEDEFDENEEALGAMFPLETFVVNLTGGGFIRCQVQLEFKENDISKRFYARLVPIRDALIQLFSTKRKEDVLSSDGKNDLKMDVRDIVNDILKKEDIEQVYFTQFVVQ